MIIFFWFLNFGISWLNAWSAGREWNEAKEAGGIPRLMAWTAAIMAACGFTWCFSILGAYGYIWGYDALNSMGMIEVDGYDPLVTAEHATMLVQAVYLVIIFPVIGIGVSWALSGWYRFIRRPSLINGLDAGWNTFASIHNIAYAFDGVPTAWGSVSKMLSSDDDEGNGVVWALLAFAVIGGVLLTSIIVKRTAAKTSQRRCSEYRAMARYSEHTART